MANYCGAARSNYVRIENREGLRQSLEPFAIDLNEKQQEGEHFCCFLSTTDSGGWPDFVEDDEGNELEFSFEELVMPYVKEGECLVVMESGAEKLRYIIGCASALVRKGDKMEVVSLTLNDIYQLAKDNLGVTNITDCSY